MSSQAIIKERQRVIDKLFPGDRMGEHKFDAYTTKCDQCGVKFADWAKNNPIRLCPVIGRMMTTTMTTNTTT